MKSASLISRFSQVEWENYIVYGTIACCLMMVKIRYSIPEFPQFRPHHRISLKTTPEFQEPPQEFLALAPIEKKESKKVIENAPDEQKTVASVTKPRRKVSKKKVEKLETVRVEPKVEEEVPVQIEDKYFDPIAEDVVDAVDAPSPLDQMVAQAFQEPSLSVDFHPDVLLSATQEDVRASLDQKMPLEKRYLEVLGEFQKNDFQDIKNILAKVSDATVLAESPKSPGEQKKPEPELVRSQATPKELKVAKSTAKKVSAPEVTVQIKPNTPVIQKVEVEANVKSEAPEPELDDLKEPTLATAEPVDEKTPQLPTEPKAPLVAMASAAPAIPSILAIQKKEQPVLVTPQVNTPAVPTQQAPVLVRPNSAPTQVAVAVDRSKHSRVIESGAIFGKLRVDKNMYQWLADHKGHLQLLMEPVGRHDKQDVILDSEVEHSKLRYRYPDDRFEIDGHDLGRQYQLFARVFRADRLEPTSKIPGPQIEASRYKENLDFYIRKSDFQRYAIEMQKLPARTLQLSVMSFETIGKYNESPPIAKTTVKVVGFPEWGTFVTADDGTVTIPHVPNQSKFLLRATADGFYETDQIVSTFSTDEDPKIYLTKKSKVLASASIAYKMKNALMKDRGIILGRTFDPHSRIPLADEEVTLSARKTPPIFFNATKVPNEKTRTTDIFDGFPNSKLLKTGDSGLFEFVNVTAPSIRVVHREGHKPPLLVDVRPNSAQYVEFGRGGSHDFWGHLISDSPMAHARVRLLGADDDSFVPVDEKGDFRIPGIDLPHGTITVEVQSEEHPPSLYTFAWNPQVSNMKHRLFVLKADLLDEKGKGVVVGQAGGYLFKTNSECVDVELADSTTELPVSEVHGPFPFSGNHSKGDPICLTPDHAGFIFKNLEPKKYIFKWFGTSTDAKHNLRRELLSADILYVAPDRQSIEVR